MRYMPLYLLGTLVLFPSFINADLYSNQPKLITEDGNLIIMTASDKNITFRTSGRGYVNLNENNLLHITQMAQQASASVSRFQQNLESNIQGRLDSLTRQVSGPRSLSTKLATLEQMVYRGNTSSGSSSLLPRRMVIIRLNRQVRRVEMQLRRLQNLLSIDECLSNPCRNGGTCQDLYNNFICVCPTNWQGTFCDVDVNECAMFSGTDLGCQNGATCINKPGTYECLCQDTYFGLHCSLRTNDCSTANSARLCGNGVCVNQGGTGRGYTCICNEGWTTDASQSCTVDVDECQSKRYPCSHDPYVACINLPGSYHCGFCPPGYIGNGFQCADVDECKTNNGGCSLVPKVPCINTMGSRVCGTCPAGFSGDGVICTPVVGGACAINNGGCFPSANCFLTSGIINCQCPDGYTGSGYGPNGCSPSTLAVHPCHINPCENGGTCTAVGSTATCVCHPFTTGPNCSQIVYASCKPNPCQNNGHCTIVNLVVGREIRCICTPGYEGPRCEYESSDCGGSYNQDSGELEMPIKNTAQQYNNGERCTWHIEVFHSKVVDINITELSIDPSENCRANYLRFEDPTSLGSTNVLCKRYTSEEKLPIIKTNSNKLTITYYATTGININRFKLSWKASQPSCGGEITATSHGTIESPFHPQNYPNNLVCEWKIVGPPGKRIQLLFNSLDLEPSTDCSKDYLKIQEYEYNEPGPVLAMYCNSSNSNPITTHLPAAYIFFHSDGSVSAKGFSITYNLVEGCGAVLTSGSGDISPPMGSDGYQDDQDCEWKIQLPVGDKIKIVFNQFDLEETDPCDDYLELRDGPSPTSPLVGKWCGSRLPPSFTSSSQFLTVIFHSDFLLSAKGFTIHYETVCGGVFTSLSGEIKTPNYPLAYYSDRECSYLIATPASTAIQLHFQDFDIESIGDECFDYLEVHDGDNANSTLIGKYCGIDRPADITSSHNYLYLVFTTDSSFGFRGFLANYSTIDLPCGGILKETTGTFSAPQGEVGYLPQAQCKWVISAEPGWVIQLSWLSFHLEYSNNCVMDVVEVYENDTTTGKSQLIDKYCGLKIPLATTSTTNMMTVTFRSDDSVHREGFTAHYVMVDKRKVCGGTYRTITGRFESPNYPNPYFNNKECTWIIHVPQGQQIRLTFEMFQIEGILNTCPYDILIVRNGLHETSPLVGKYCGSNIPPDIISLTNGLWIHFSSDRSANDKGFIASWDATSTGCGGTLTGMTGSIMSPNYPQPYKRYAECFFKISVSQGSKVHLSFIDLDLETNSHCSLDYIEVFDGLDDRSPSLGRFCSSEQYPSSLLGTTNYLSIKFVSDISYSGRGFHLKYHTECNVTLTSRFGSIESPNYPNNYSPNLNCIWVIRAPLGNKLNITIDHFELKEDVFIDSTTSAQSCTSSDYLEISQSSLDEVTPTQQLIKACGNDYGPGKFSTSVEKAYIHFVSDNLLENSGFRLEWAVVGCGGVFRKPMGTFTSPNYPNGYPTQVVCEWQIIAPWDKSIEITLFDIHMEDIAECHFDYFAIFAGEDDTAPILIKACHQQKQSQIFSTSGNHAFIKFQSDHSLSGRGFSASWRFVDAKCGGRFTSPFGAIYSHNYPKNYNNHDDCEWLIQVPTNHLVNLTFSDFDIESPSGNLTTDYVNVYDGSSIKSPLLLSHTGNQLPQPAYVISTGNTMLVRHKADGSVTAKGFSAHYTLACGARISANGTGTFSLTDIVSAESPWAVDSEVNCTWYIIAENPADKISLTFTMLDLSPTEENSEDDCSYNYVAIHDGDDTNATIVSRVCGTKVPPTLRSSGSALTVHVASVTNYRSRLGRFTALYSTYSTACGGELISEEGSFASPNYPDGYPGDADCEWTLKASAGNKVTLSFISFELEKSEHCNTDYVEIRSGKNDGKLLGVFCGSDIPTNITAHNALWIRFRSDDLNTAPGFMASYSLVHGSELAGDLGQIASPLYPHNFVQEGDYTWTITVSTNKVVRITFSEFYMDQYNLDECPSASLKIFDGPSGDGSSAPLLTTCGSTLPKPVISHGNTVTVLFHNEPVVHGSYFVLNWEGVSQDRAFPTTVMNTSIESSLGCGKLIHLSPVSGNHSVVITSPNYPKNYENNLKCSWIIDTSVGFHLRLKFTAFDLETYDDCELDFVTVYTESATETTGWKALSEHLCLPATTDLSFVSGNHMKLTFETDDSLRRSGFSAVVTAVCGGMVTSLSGSINLTGLPVNETMHKVKCDWVFTVRSGRTIQFKLSNFNLKQAQESCGSNYIMLRNGGYNDSPPLGNAKYCESDTPVILQSSSNRVFVSYSAMSSSLGVFVEYEELDYDCNHEIMLGTNMPSKMISTPNYPEVPSTSHITCTWSVTVPPGESIQINFVDRFDLKYSFGCTVEYLEIYDGATELSPVIGRYCRVTPNPIVSHGNHMLIKYFTDAEMPNNGFKASVTIATCGGTYLDMYTPITLTSPKYPSNYPPNLDCIWRIASYSDYSQIKIEVAELFLGGKNETCDSTSDFIEFINVDIRTKNMTDDPPPIKLCGQRTNNLTGNELVPPSSSNEMYIRFHSGQLTDKFNKRYFSVTISTKGHSCRTELNSPSGVITSRGYPTPVPRRTYTFCTWAITVPEGRRISLKILDFDPEPLQHTKQTKLTILADGQYIRGLSVSSDNCTLPIESSSNTMEIVYAERSISGAHRGFKAEFSSDNPVLCGGELAGSGTVGFSALGHNLKSYLCKWTYKQDLMATNLSTLTVTINGTLSVPRNVSSGSCSYFPSQYDSVLIVRVDSSSGLGSLALICQETTMPYVLRTSNPNVNIMIRKAISRLTAEQASPSIANVTISYKTDACGGTVLGPQAVISSPGFPNRYPPNTDCSWTVKFRKGTTIRVRFDQLDMGPDCNNQFLLLYNGDTQMKPHLTKPLCGNQAPSQLITQTNEMLVEFHSGPLESKSYSGFKIVLDEESTGCGGTVHKDYGTIKSPNYDTKDYPNNVECEWNIILSPGFHAGIKFIDRFSLESSAGCTNDYIQIFDWVNENWVQIGSNICGREPPANITTRTNQFRVLFRTSSSITSDGFSLEWENLCGGTFEVEGEGIIISPNYPKDYSYDLLCTYKLLAPSKTIYGRFDDFAVEESQTSSGDRCRFDNVTLVTNFLAPRFRFSISSVFFRFSPTKRETFCGFQIPAPVYSYNNLELIFQTDGIIEHKGFLFKYSVANCGSNITSPTTISNPNNDQLRNCTWFITAPEDKIVSIKLTMERMFTPYCGLKIYDGHSLSNESSLIVSVCSSFTFKRSRYTSSGNKMAVLYADPRYRPMQFKIYISFSYGVKHNCGGTIRLADVTLPYTLRSVDVNGDGKYEPQLSCDWLLLSPESHQIHLTINKLDIQNCSNCECDVLEIHDGDHNGMPQLGRFCGSNVSTVPNIISSYGSLLIHFSSDGATELSGFQLTATTQLNSCGVALKNASSVVQILESPGYSGHVSGGPQLCRWFIFSPGRNAGELSLHITDLDLPSPCANNYLEISELWTMSKFLLGREATPWDSRTTGEPLKLCGNRTTEVTFSGHNAQIRLVTSSIALHRGFKMEYRMKGCSDNYTQPYGRIKFNYFSFPVSEICYRRIQAPHSNLTISLYFNNFFCLPDERAQNNMMIFDGNSDQAEELLSVCSTRRPNPVFSNGPALYIKWQDHQSLGGYDITYTTTDKGRGCGGRFSNFAGVFSSPLYPSIYKKDSNCRWDVTVPHGNKIVFTFKFFDIGPLNTCSSNNIKFFDIDTSTGIETLHAQYCGTETPAEIQMNGDTAFVQYKTTTENKGTGWDLRWSAVPNNNFV